MGLGLEIFQQSACPTVQIADSTAEFGSLMGKVQGIVWDLTHAQATVECIWDPTLHPGSLGKGKMGNTGGSALPRSLHSLHWVCKRLQGML